MALDDPSRKMSKSEPGGAISLLDPPAVVRRKVARAVTDSLGVVRYDPLQVGLYNLLSIHQLLSGMSPPELESHFEGMGYRVVKEEVAELISAALQPLQERYDDYRRDPDLVDQILAEGAERAHALAAPLVRTVEERMGLRVPAGPPQAARAAL
jgi:tryptophanyl-tRNA synthetase